MRSLLPKKEIQHFQHEYHLRFSILLVFFLSVAVWIGIISLFPSYIFSITEEKNASDEANKIHSTLEKNGSSQVVTETKDANTLIGAVASSQDSLFFSSLIEDIDSRRLPGMILTSFSLSHVSGGAGSAGSVGSTGGTSGTAGGPNSQSTITISGTAATRSVLVDFEQNLENDPRLTKVELPVSALAQNTNINFTINMQGIQ